MSDVRTHPRRAAALLLAGALASAAAAGVASAAFTATTTTTGTFAAATAFPPVVSAVPTILGVAQAGFTVVADPGSFSPSATANAYVWHRCDSGGSACAQVATGASYAVTTADAGSTLRVIVTPSNGPAVGAATSSDATPVVRLTGLGPLLQAPANLHSPTIGGAPAVGDPTTATPGDWVLGVTLAYQWLRCDTLGTGCATINDATAATYTPVDADAGRRLRVRVTASVLGLLPNSALSRASAVVT